jgi:hypothetical protein
MQKLIVIPGNSKRNKEWGEAVVSHYAEKFDDVYMQSYDHWESGEQDINIEVELNKLREVVESSDADYIVFAKSIGSLLTLLAVQKGFIQPKKCVFFGMPLEMASQELFKDDWSPLATFSIPAIAFHNDNDPINHDYTKEALEAHSSGGITFYTKVGSDHNYTEFEAYDEEIDRFLNASI